jgi:hypothetical protein
MNVICPHCGDETQQDFLLKEFTCGACDQPFTPTTTDKPQDQFDNYWAICPWCGYKHGDCSEWARETVETTCDGCGKTFMVEPDYSVTYTCYARWAEKDSKFL